MTVELSYSFKNLKRIIIVLYPVDIISQNLLFSEKLFQLILKKETNIVVSGIFNICLATFHITLVRYSKESLG